MSIVSYNECCCDCIKINGAKGLIVVNSSVAEYLKMTEYEFSSTLDSWMEDIDSFCHFCGSKNIYGENIQIDNIPLYKFEYIVENIKKYNHAENFLIFNLKKSDGIIKRNLGGKESNNGDFFIDCWPTIIGAIDEIPENRFAKIECEGNFLMALTGVSENVRIQSLKMCGFKKYELIREVNNFFSNINF